jgi:hypothetical protein
MAKANKGMAKRPWQDITREVQDYRNASIGRVQPSLPRLPNNLPASVIGIPNEVLGREEVQITQASPEDLILKLATGNLTAIAVTRAFLRRAALAQNLVSSPHLPLGLHPQ